MGLTRLFLAWVAVVPWLVGAAHSGDAVGCEPSREWEMVAPSLQYATLGCGRDPDCLKGVEARWQEAIGRQPGNMRAYWSYARAWSLVDRSRIERAFRDLKEANPRDPFFVTAYGHTLSDRREAQIAAYRQALDIDPGYGWAHYYLATLFTAGDGNESQVDQEQARVHLRGWLEACPADAAGLQMAGSLDDQAFAADLAARARRALETASGEWALRRYEALWTLEFKVTPAAEHAALRERVRRDAARLTTAEPSGSIALWRALDKAYELAGDPAARAAVQRRMREGFPCENSTLRSRITEWEKAHPRPPYGADASVRREYYAGRYRLETELARSCPATPLVATSRVRTARELVDLPDRELEGVIDDYLAVHGSAPGVFLVGGSDPAVEICVNRRVRLEKVPELIRIWRAALLPPPRPDAPESTRSAYERMRRDTEWQQAWLQARAENLLGRASERDASLENLETIREATPPGERLRIDAQLAWLRAEIADRENRPVDAVVFYLQAFAGLRYDEEVVRASREALKRLGASDAALATLEVPKRPPIVFGPPSWKDIDRELPAASLETVGGGRWSVGDLKGKRTLLNVWATWCGPCKEELPELQKLTNRIKGRPDVAVVTFNVDENPGLVEPFMKENGLTFPVVFARGYWDSLKLSQGIPTSWIVDAKGVARAELRGFGPDARWVEDVLAKLEGKAESPSTRRD